VSAFHDPLFIQVRHVVPVWPWGHSLCLILVCCLLFCSSHDMGDQGKDWRLPVLDDSGKPAKDKTNTIGVVTGDPPHHPVKGAQVLVIVAREVVVQYRDDLSECERARG